MNKNEIMRLTIDEAKTLIHQGELSPVDLVDTYLGRIHATEDEMHSFISVYDDMARMTAQGLECMQKAGHFLGDLHGIPVAIKDNISLGGCRTAAGSKIREKWIASTDATIVARLKSAGAVIVGHTNMHEFAWGATTENPHYGTARNPWDHSRFCSGSSGGSGASVANGTSMVAIGTDTGGSTRQPSGINGLVGLRPTLGRISNAGIVPCGWSMDTSGPMTRTVRDNALVLNAIAGYDYRDPGTSKVPVVDYTADLDRGVKNMRIGIIPDILFHSDQEDVVKAVKQVIQTYKDLGAQIVEFKFEHLDQELTYIAWTILNAVEGSAFHQKEIRECPEKYGSDVRLLLQSGEFLPGTYYLQAQRFRRLLQSEFKEAFKDVDAFLYPTLPYTALKLGDYKLVINGQPRNFLDVVATYSAMSSLTGSPALAVPCGLDHQNLPISFQLLGRPFEEAVLYRIAAAYEKEFHLYDRLPATW